MKRLLLLHNILLIVTQEQYAKRTVLFTERTSDDGGKRKMKKWILLIVAAAILLSGCQKEIKKSPSSEGYDRKKAVEYALKYAEKRNPAYPNVQLNCTNFVSQCLAAGGKKEDPGKVPKKGHGISFDRDKNKWYRNKKVWDSRRPASFYTSTAFVRTDAFLNIGQREEA